MNDKFFKLPLEKQRRIINATYKVFSENSYKKAPMSEIADRSGISKALLFHYFTNNQENYKDVSKASEMTVFEKIDLSKFRKDIDLKTMYAEIFYAIDGYMLKKYRSNCIIPDEIEEELTVLIDFWKKVYTREV